MTPEIYEQRKQKWEQYLQELLDKFNYVVIACNQAIDINSVVEVPSGFGDYKVKVVDLATREDFEEQMPNCWDGKKIEFRTRYDFYYKVIVE
jgi:hypothetical protein